MAIITLNDLVKNDLAQSATVTTKPVDRGPWIQTHTGVAFHILDPQPEDIAIEDIAHALSNTCRFVGHTNKFYSVAQHSVIISDHLPQHLKLAGLLHDASEAYLNDFARPFKKLLIQYSGLEAWLMGAIANKFGFEYPFDPLVKQADTAILHDERD
ncbi:MAG: metal-dependent phosphohydrolase [Pseudomonadota bacterium]